MSGYNNDVCGTLLTCSFGEYMVMLGYKNDVV